MYEIFFIPTHPTSLAHYFNGAIILPSKSYSNRPADVQTKTPNSILLSKTKWVVDADCSIEVVITIEESQNLVSLGNGFFELLIALPISRIKTIFFQNSEQAQVTTWNINQGTAFIPRHLIRIEPAVGKKAVLADTVLSNTNASQELTKKVNLFDRILGGITFMQAGAKINVNIMEIYYPILALFNGIIAQEWAAVANALDAKTTTRYHGLFTKTDGEWSKWLPYIYNDAPIDNIQQLADEEGVIIERRHGVINLDSVNRSSHLFELTTLAAYGDGKVKGLDQLVLDLSNGVIPREKAIDVAIVFGLNKGYSAFRNRYRFASGEVVIKLPLDNTLQYYIIESIYQVVFNGHRSLERFKYLDPWTPKDRQANQFKGKQGIYSILDHVVLIQNPGIIAAEWEKRNTEQLITLFHASLRKIFPNVSKFDEPKITQLVYRDFEKFIHELPPLTNTNSADKTGELEEKNQNLEKVNKRLQSANQKLERELAALKNTRRNPELFQNSQNLKDHTFDAITRADLEYMLEEDLIIIARQLGIKDVSELTKTELIRMITNKQQL